MAAECSRQRQSLPAELKIEAWRAHRLSSRRLVRLRQERPSPARAPHRALQAHQSELQEQRRLMVLANPNSMEGGGGAGHTMQRKI